MKKKTKEKLRSMSIEELKQELDKREKEYVQSKFKLNQGQLEDVHLPSKLKREIAVIKTIMAEKQSVKEKKEDE